MNRRTSRSGARRALAATAAAALAAAAGSSPRDARATVFSYDGVTSYTQNFDSLPNGSSGTTNTRHAGWRDDTPSPSPSTSVTVTQNMGLESWYYVSPTIITSGTGDDLGDQRMRITSGNTTTGALYDFGANTNTERALGFLDANTLNADDGTAKNEGQPGQYLALRIRNNSGQTLTQFTLTYTGEQWHEENTTVQQINFSYAILDPATTPALSPRTSGAIAGTSQYYSYLMTEAPYTAVPALNFVSPIHATATSTALDGNDYHNRLFGINATVTGLSWAAGTDIWLRWVDINDVARDQGLALDDLTFSASAAAASTAASNWNADADGTWSTAAKWLNGAPNGVGAKAQLYSVISAARTVTLDQDVTLGSLTIANNYAYKLDGAGHTLTIDAGAGQHGALTVNAGPNAGTHEITAPVTFATPADVTVGVGGRLKLSGAVTGKVSSLALIFGGIDLGSNDLTIDYTGASPIDNIRTYLNVGRGTGAWDGTTSFGITSAAANADFVAHPAQAKVAYGYAEASQTPFLTFDGNSLDGTTLLLKLTVYGDANLNGKVDADDYALLDRGFARYAAGVIGLNAAHWTDGDFDYNGTVDASDYLLIDRVLGVQGGGFSPEFLAARQAEFGDAYVADLLASVPEPSSLAACGLALLPLARRRRSR